MRDKHDSDSRDSTYGDGPTERPGRVRNMPPAGTTPLHSLPSFADPVAENIDPTSPASPEQTFDYQRDEHDQDTGTA